MAISWTSVSSLNSLVRYPSEEENELAPKNSPLPFSSFPLMTDGRHRSRSALLHTGDTAQIRDGGTKLNKTAACRMIKSLVFSPFLIVSSSKKPIDRYIDYKTNNASVKKS
ncbi:hypothetical protein [Paenibacillus harenae]|uniref:hypothetical protein n=1 Tax=Paenibacillus harenae TaxID=306543 RepID=UPI0027915700|nr:hypothetical protein [Paenibacillus harenae]MDQ0062916.1 hypothetical protein [Paenibacillus harenae]